MAAPALMARTPCWTAAEPVAQAFSTRVAGLKRSAGVGEHDRGGAVRNQRAVGTLERSGDVGVLLALAPAKLEAEVLAHLGIGVVDAVLVVLGGNHSECVRLVAVALEIGLRDLAEDAGEAGRRVAIFRQVRGLEPVSYTHLTLPTNREV